MTDFYDHFQKNMEALGLPAPQSCTAGCAAALYAGAVIGSLAVASGKTLAGSTSLADVLYTAKKHKLDRKWLPATLQRWPGLYDSKLVASRNKLRARAFA